MSEDRGRRRRLGSLGAGALGSGGRARPQKIGDPNVLSDAATPNRLSTEAGRPKGLPVGTRETPTWTPATTAAPTVRAPQRSRRVPSLSTVLFVGFVVFTAIRFLGQTVGESAPVAPVATSPGDAPGAIRSSDPEPSLAPAEPGAISFGTGSDGDCGVTDDAIAFNVGTDVWWSAQLSAGQPPEAGAVVIVHRDDAEISRETVPPDTSVGEWDVLCSSEPVAEQGRGDYRVEVWDENTIELLAVGEYRLS
jgi:hypothetical protein